MDINARIAQFVAIRDAIAKRNEAFKQEMAPYHDALQKLNALLLDHMNAMNVSQLKSEAGTAYVSTMSSVSVTDKQAFREYIETTGNWNVADLRASKTACEAMLVTDEGLPPGVSYSARKVVNVRRATLSAFPTLEGDN
jgi:hypothetical protein